MKKERSAIERLKPKRYILATSQPLTPLRKGKLQRLLEPFLRYTKDILGATDLNDLLRKYPNIEKGHIKLWLSSTAVLERLMRSASVAYTAITKEEILNKVRVYAQNASFDEALNVLKQRHVVIISGAPGVGKTTLAQMLAYAFIGEDWEFVAIKSLEDGFAAIDDTKRQIFFFDDFLGKIGLDKKALASKDADLARFLHRVQRSKNARFVLTTRAYIYEEARAVSESIGDKRFDISKYVLDVGIYTRRVKARILYNHLVASGLGNEFVVGLVESGLLPRIVDHKNYNPRIIEWMTDPTRMTSSPADYAKDFLEALDKPFAIWDRAFREHIPPKAQHLLISLFFTSKFETPFDDLRGAFECVHARLCAKHHVSSSPTDFEESVQLLEGSFIHISDGDVSFVNPSVRDYLSNYLSNESLLRELPYAARTANAAALLWEHAKEHCSMSKSAELDFIQAFTRVASQFDKLPTSIWREEQLVRTDLPISERVELLAEWAYLSDLTIFSDAMLRMVENPPGTYSAWSDGDELLGLISNLRGGRWRDVPHAESVADRLEQALVATIEVADADDLKRILRALEMEYDIPESVRAAFEDSVRQEVRSVDEIVGQLESESEVEDHLETLTELAEWTGVNVSSAQVLAEARIDAIRSDVVDQYPDPDFSEQPKRRADFDDDALQNLFASLIET